MKVKPSVALIVGVILAVIMAVQYVIPGLPLWVHIAVSTVVAICGIYGLTVATPAVIAAALSPRVLALVAALVSGFAGVLPLIRVGSTWHAILSAILGLVAVLIPSVVPVAFHARVAATLSPGDPGPARGW